MQQRGVRPPPLPPPPPPTAPTRGLLSTSSAATASPSLDAAALQVRQSLPPSPALPVAAGDSPPAPSSSSSSLSGGLRITLPLLLPPPPRPSEDRIDTGASAGIGVSAEDLESGGIAEQQLVSSQSSQPVFFLQVPGGGLAPAPAAAAPAGVTGGSLREGERWSSQYLSADTGADPARAAPVTYGRDTEGGGGRQARSAAVGGRGSGGGWSSASQADSQAGDNAALDGGSSGGGGGRSRVPPSFGRASRRGLPSSSSSKSLPLPRPRPPPPPPGKTVPHLVLVSLNLEGGRVGSGGSGGGVEGEVRMVRAEAMDAIKATKVRAPSVVNVWHDYFVVDMYGRKQFVTRLELSVRVRSCWSECGHGTSSR